MHLNMKFCLISFYLKKKEISSDLCGESKLNLIPGNILLKVFSTHRSIKFVSCCGSISNLSSEVPQLQKTLTKIGTESI